MIASASAHPDQIAALKKLRVSMDPFQLGKVIERKIEGIHEMANRRHSPQTMQIDLRRQSGVDRRSTLENPSPSDLRRW
jgi:hypothetical protein